jgi:hypothetical protein
MTTAFEDKPLPGQLDDVRGWFPPLDQVLFQTLLTHQEERGESGDLLELGAYMGKSAIFLGRHLQEGEKFTVCDLFESEAPDGANLAETTKSYSTLTRDAFEANYLSFHDELPRVLQAPSSVVPGEVEPKTCRFVHVDASHLYEHVHGDIGAAQEALLPGGIVVLDDFRSEHTPGVSVAAWEAVLNRGLRPICLSTQKMYATWDDPEPFQDTVITMVQELDMIDLSIQEAAEVPRTQGPGLPLLQALRGAAAGRAGTGPRARRKAGTCSAAPEVLRRPRRHRLVAASHHPGGASQPRPEAGQGLRSLAAVPLPPSSPAVCHILRPAIAGYGGWAATLASATPRGDVVHRAGA